MTDVVLLGGRTGPSPRWHGLAGRLGHRRHVGLGALQLVAVAAIIVAGAAVLGWNLSGGRLAVMETPSMCPAVCIGSLVADRPLSGPLHKGELITFHPPGNNTETYTHEVAAVFPAGVQTRGVGNAYLDPWLITRSDIVGQVSFNVWGLGWLMRALPFLAVGVLLWVITRVRVSGRYRRAWDRAWVCALVVVPAVLLRPLVRAVVHATAADLAHRGWVRSTVVNTGMLPAQFKASAGTIASHVASGHLGRLETPSKGGFVVLHETASLYWWGWAIVALVVSSPLTGYLWHTYRGTEVVPTFEPA